MQLSNFCEYQKVNVKEARDMRTIIVAVKFWYNCGWLTSEIWQVINTYLLKDDIHK